MEFDWFWYFWFQEGNMCIRPIPMSQWDRYYTQHTLQSWNRKLINVHCTLFKTLLDIYTCRCCMFSVRRTWYVGQLKYWCHRFPMTDTWYFNTALIPVPILPPRTSDSSSMLVPTPPVCYTRQMLVAWWHEPDCTVLWSSQHILRPCTTAWLWYGVFYHFESHPIVVKLHVCNVYSVCGVEYVWTPPFVHSTSVVVSALTSALLQGARDPDGPVDHEKAKRDAKVPHSTAHFTHTTCADVYTVASGIGT